MSRSKITKALLEEPEGTPPEEPTPEEPTPQEPEPISPQTEPEGDEPPAAPSAPPPESITIDGVDMPLDEARGLLQFRAWAAQNPQAVADIADYLEGRRRLVAVEEPSKPQESTAAAPRLTDEDLEDLPAAVRE